MSANNQDASNDTVIKVRPAGRDSTPIEVTYPLPESLSDLVNAFGEKVVASKAREKIRINLQDTLRAVLQKEPKTTKAQLQKVANEWKPTVHSPIETKKRKAKAFLEQLPPAEREALLKEWADKK